MRTPTKLRHVAAISALLALAVSTACSGDDTADEGDAELWCETLRGAFDEVDSIGRLSADTERRIRDLRPDEIDEEDLAAIFELKPSIADYDDAEEFIEAETDYFEARHRASDQTWEICGLSSTDEQ